MILVHEETGSSYGCGWQAPFQCYGYVSATCNLPLSLVYHQGNVYYRCHSEYHLSSACTAVYYVIIKEKTFKITSLCLLERKKNSCLFHEDVRMKLYVTWAYHIENGTQGNVFKNIYMNGTM